MSHRALAWAMLATVVAGCAVPSPAPGGTALPEVDEVDLHDAVMNITMPGDQPTALVVLDVTKDMWVRPFADFEHTARDPTFWILCPWVRSLGLGEGNSFSHIPFWLDGNVLTPATKSQDGMDGTTDAVPGRCVSQVSTPNRPATIAADAPREGTLVLLLAATNRTLRDPPDPAAPPLHEFRFLVGIARDPCEVEGRPTLCPPEGSVPAEPFARAGRRLDAQQQSPWPACDGCGLEIQDSSVTAPVPLDQAGFGSRVSVGKLTATRVSDPASGLVIARISVNGQTAVDARLWDEAGETSLRCESDAFGFFWLIRPREAGVVTFEAAMDMKGNIFWHLLVKEFPFDLQELGWTFAPTTLLRTGTSAFSGTTTGQCT